MADVVSVTLEANISGRTTGQFAKFDRLVKGIGKSVLLFGKHTDRLSTSVGKLETALGRRGGFAMFNRNIDTSSRKAAMFGKQISSVTSRLAGLNSAFANLARTGANSFAGANTGLQSVRRSAVQVAAAYRAAERQMAALQRAAGRSPRGIRMPPVTIGGRGGAGGGAGGGGQGGPGGGGFGGGFNGGLVQASVSATLMGRTMTNFGRTVFREIDQFGKAGMGLEQALTDLTARLDKSDKALAPMLKEETARLSRVFGIVPTEIVASFEAAAAMGVRARALPNAGDAITTMATAGSMDAETASKGLGTILAAYGYRDKNGALDFSKALDMGDGKGGLNDILTYVADRTQTNERELFRAFEYSAASFKAAGLDVVQSASYLGAASNVARTGTKGGRDMAEIIGRISRSDVGEKVEESLGVRLLDAEGNIKDTISLMAEMGQAFDKMTEGGTKNMGEALSLQREFFGEQGLKAFAAFQASLESTRDIQDEINKGMAKGVARAKALEKANTTAKDIERLKGAWSDLSATILMSNRGPIKSFVQLLTKGIDKVNLFAQKYPRLTQGVLLGAAAFGTLAVAGGIALTVLGQIGVAAMGVQAVFGLLQGSVMGANLIGMFSSWGAMTAGLSAGFSSLAAWGSSVLAFITGPVAIGIAAAGALIYQFWEPLKVTFGSFFSGLITAYKSAVEVIRPAFGEFLEGLKPFGTMFKNLFAQLGLTGDAATILGGIFKALGWVVGKVLARPVVLIAKALGWAGKVLGFVGNALLELWGIIDSIPLFPFGKDVLTLGDALMFVVAGPVQLLKVGIKALNAVATPIMTTFREIGRVLYWVNSVFTTIHETISGKLTESFEWLKSTARSVGDAFTEAFKPVNAFMDSVASKMESTLRALPKFLRPASAKRWLAERDSERKKAASPEKAMGTAPAETGFFGGIKNWFKEKDVARNQRNERVLAIQEAGRNLESTGILQTSFFGGVTGVDNKALQEGVADGTVTNKDLIALQERYKVLEAGGYDNPELEHYFEQLKTTSYREPANLNSSPTINITVNGNGDAQEIGSEVTKALSKHQRELARKHREEYADDFAM